jgi:hypothetical protein
VSDRLRRDAPVFLLGAGLTASAVLISVWQSKLSYAFDDWDLLLGRLGSSLDVFLAPHHEHISIAPVAIYKTLLSAFGLSSPRPFQIVSACLFLAVLVLVFVYLRRRVGAWLALAGVLPLLFFGPAWDNVLWSFQIGFTGSLAAGVGALLALDREDERGDLAACVLLTVGVSFSSLWLPFAIGAAVHVLTGTARLRRAYVFAVPGALWALWWLGWGHEAESAITFDNLATIPQYLLEGLASSLHSLVGMRGLDGQTGTVELDWARILLVGIVALAAVRLLRMGRVPRGVWITTAIALSFWVLSAMNANAFRHPTIHRYQLIGAVLLLLVAAEVWRGVRPSRAVVGGALAIAVAATVSNLTLLHHEWETFRSYGERERGELAAVELARDSIAPSFVLAPQVADAGIYGNVGLYLQVADAYGSPAYSPDELAAAPEGARVAADRTFAAALGIGLEPLSRPPPGACLRAPGNAGAPRVLTLPAGGAVIELARGGGRARVRRYASEEFPVELGAVSAGASRLEIPTDGSDEPWELELVADGPVSVCRV